MNLNGYILLKEMDHENSTFQGQGYNQFYQFSLETYLYGFKVQV